MDGGFRAWLSGLSGREMAVYAALGLAALAGAGLWFARSMPSPVPIQASSKPVAGPSPGSEPLFVHVAGWVHRPGVYELRAGDRVIDAIEAAGGPRRRADLDSLNLAGVLTDGQQVLVARRTSRASEGLAPAAGAEASGKVNLNAADAAALDTLPGIGEVLAARIIEHRERHGPFRSVDDLLDVSGIGQVTLEDLRDLVTV